MSNLGVILPIIIAATLGAGAMYFMSGNEEDKPLYNNPNNNPNKPQYVYNDSPERMSTGSYDSGSGQEAYIGGLTKRRKNKNIKKKSKNRRRKSKK